MPLFCKQCNGRRTPIFQKEENKSFWLCEKCNNFVDEKDYIIREITEAERKEMDQKLKDFENDTSSISKENMTRRKGVN